MVVQRLFEAALAKEHGQLCNRLVSAIAAHGTPGRHAPAASPPVCVLRMAGVYSKALRTTPNWARGRATLLAL